MYGNIISNLQFVEKSSWGWYPIPWNKGSHPLKPPQRLRLALSKELIIGPKSNSSVLGTFCPLSYYIFLFDRISVI